MGIEFAITSDVRTDPGKKRDHNEDFLAFFVPDDPDERQRSGCLYIVADGVGGAMDGEIASRYAAEKILYDYYHDDEPDLGERLRHIIQQTGNDIFEHSQTGGRFKRMATTVVAAAIQGERLIVANVGDSRAYLIRDGEAHQITRDHTVAGELLRDHKISEKEARDQPGKNRLTRSVGGESDVHVDIFLDISLLPGDRILLCSDGLARYTLSQDIAHLASSGSPEEITKRCIDYANRKGGVDNVTVATIEIGSPSEGAVTVRAPSAHAPVPVDLDTLSTDPSLTVVHRKKRWPGPSRKGILIMAGVTAVLLLTTLAFVLGSNLNAIEIAPLKSTTELTATPSPLVPVATTLLALTQPAPEFTQAITGTEALAPVTPTLTPEVTIGLPGSAVTAAPQGSCVYKVQPGDALLAIVDRFGLSPDKSQEFLHIVSNDKNMLSPQKPILIPDDIHPGWLLLVPVFSQEECEPHGEWLPVIP